MAEQLTGAEMLADSLEKATDEGDVTTAVALMRKAAVLLRSYGKGVRESVVGAEKVRREVRELRGQVMQLEARFAEREAVIRDLENENEALRDRIDEMSRDAESARNEVEDLQRVLAGHKTEWPVDVRLLCRKMAQTDDPDQRWEVAIALADTVYKMVPRE
jgi:chromosome segregation ATPase